MQTDAGPQNGEAKNGTASNRDNLPQRNLGVAQAVLDRLGCLYCVSIKERPLFRYLNVPRIEGVTTMATIETFKRGDEVLSKLLGGPIMTVLAVEGMKVRCSDEQDRQYWFDTILLKRCCWTETDPDGTEEDSLPESFPETKLPSLTECLYKEASRVA